MVLGRRENSVVPDEAGENSVVKDEERTAWFS